MAHFGEKKFKAKKRTNALVERLLIRYDVLRRPCDSSFDRSGSHYRYCRITVAKSAMLQAGAAANRK